MIRSQVVADAGCVVADGGPLVKSYFFRLRDPGSVYKLHAGPKKPEKK